ncbi:MAG: hypothetical protein HY744_18790 [Deltaproteobacteria bacterium]|nr:hypothetical protein [Deltaproteobacteria bacterium]
MLKVAEETARLAGVLPPDKAQALLEFARFLAEKADEESWERRLADPTRGAKLRAEMVEVEQGIAAGLAEPLDPARL